MLRIITIIFLSVVVIGSAHAGILKERVELADLTALSQKDLDTFKDAEFRVFL
jgi:hypothetical protein